MSESESWEESGAKAAEWDEVLCRAVALTAAMITLRPGQTKIAEEEHLIPKLKEALIHVLGEGRVERGRALTVPDWLPDWDPLPGRVDVVVGVPPTPLARPCLGIEAKSRSHNGKLGETPYDIFKMAALRRMEAVEAAYLVAAAPVSAFTNIAEPGARLFNGPIGEAEDWYSSYFIEEWPDAWAQLLSDSSGRPLRVPRTLWLQRVCTDEVLALPGWEIRVVRVENPSHGGWLVFGSDGWLCHLDPDPWAQGPRQIPDSRLQYDDVPPPDCPEGDLHRFALSHDGYAREGNLANCASLANEAKQRWDATGELPSDLRSLRSCLFFEQRRAQKSGYGFGELGPRTLDYVRAIAEAIRERAEVPTPAGADLGLTPLSMEVVSHQRYPPLGWRVRWYANGKTGCFWVKDRRELRHKLSEVGLLWEADGTELL